MRTINREPLGIRKLDVQEERREARAWARGEARRVLRSHLLAEEDTQLFRTVYSALLIGWERGVQEGARATRERVAESLKNGRLVKTR